MDKREEIREGLLSKVRSIRNWRNRDDDPLSAEDDTEDILNYLHRQGFVLRVDKELPDAIPEFCVVNLTEGRGYPRCIAGYVATEKLI